MATATVTFNPGDHVQQAPAPTPPVMTVLAHGVRGDVECEWYVGGTRETGWFNPSTLHLVQ